MILLGKPDPADLALTAGSSLASFLVALAAGAASTALAAEIYLGRPADAGRALVLVLRRLPTVLAVAKSRNAGCG